MIDATQAASALLLLGIANGAPILARRLLGTRGNWPIDGGRRWRDGRPLFGPGKTFRGLAAALALTAPAAALLGYGWQLGLSLAALALLGDLAASFVKRRLGIAVHGQAIGLDQLPETLLPLLVLRAPLGLGYLDAVLVAVAFVGLELAVSPILFRLGIRRKPY